MHYLEQNKQTSGCLGEWIWRRQLIQTKQVAVDSNRNPYSIRSIISGHANVCTPEGFLLICFYAARYLMKLFIFGVSV